jgi:hypothetical protein
LRTVFVAIWRAENCAPYRTPVTARPISSGDAGLFQSRYVAEFFTEIRCAYNPAHHFCVSCLWHVADEQPFLGSERYARLDGERVF